MKELLVCKNVTKKYGEKIVLDDVTFSIPKGKIVGLLGKNGAGKSSLIKLINDLLTLDSGEIFVKGKKVGIETKKMILTYLKELIWINL